MGNIVGSVLWKSSPQHNAEIRDEIHQLRIKHNLSPAEINYYKYKHGYETDGAEVSGLALLLLGRQTSRAKINYFLQDARTLLSLKGFYVETFLEDLMM